MKNKRKSIVKVPISLKLVSIFSILVICILSGITVMISTLVRSEERIKAEENNHIINARTAETIQETIVNVQSNADGFLNALLVINDSPDFETQSKLLFEEGLINQFIDTDDYNDIIKRAIENHNKKYIEDGSYTFFGPIHNEYNDPIKIYNDIKEQLKSTNKEYKELFIKK